MNILHLSALPVWSMEGKAGMPSLRETLRGHIRGGHSVVLVLPRYLLFGDAATPIVTPEDDGYEVHAVPCRWAPLLFRLRRFLRSLSDGPELPYVFRWLLNLSMCLLLTASLLGVVLRLRRRGTERFDLVYAHNQYASLAGWLVGRMLRVPNVTRLYGTFLPKVMKKPLVTLRYPVAAAGFLVPHSLLICVNDGCRADEVVRKFRLDLQRFRFWQNGVDPPDQTQFTSRSEFIAHFPSMGLRLQAKWVVVCSRLAHLKRIDRILRALKVARDDGCDCQLVVGGDGPDRSRLVHLAIELGVADNVVWFGTVPREHVWSLMQFGDVFVINNGHSNRCNPLYEAICSGLPIVSAKDPLTADLLDEGVNALLVDKDDVEGLGRSIHRVCTDAGLAARMRRSQRERAKQLWSWQERMATEVAVLEALVAGRLPALEPSS